MLVVAALLLGVIGFLPLFKWNLASTAPTEFFDTWDLFSESLVLAKIESTTPLAQAPGTDRAGLLIAGPNAGVIYETFNGLATGTRPLADQYDSYISNLGLQGFLFLGLYDAGCNTRGCLETVNSGFTALALVGFSLLLASVASRSFAVVFLLVAAGSPWIVASARNLYWMPSSWFLPAIAAACFVLASTRRRRTVCVVALFACFALRFGMGYEYITSIALLAAGMPLLAHAFGRTRSRGFRAALRDAGIVMATGVAAFFFVLIFLLIDVGNGDAAAGLRYVWSDAAKRTVGAGSDDPASILASSASPFTVLARYTIGWQTDVVSFGAGTPFEFIFGPQTLWLLIVGAAVVVLARFWFRDPSRRRDALVLALGLAVPLSWYVLAKAHSFVHTPMNYVLWYLLGVSALFWVILMGVRDLVSSGMRRVPFSVPPSAPTVVADQLMPTARESTVDAESRPVGAAAGARAPA